MTDDNATVSLDEILTQPWQAVANETEHDACSCLAHKFFERATALENSDDLVPSRVFRFLGQIAFMHLDLRNEDSPFRPAIVMSAGRSSALEDLGDETLSVIENLIPKTTIPYLRARFADIIWLTRKNHKAAGVAVLAYLESFKRCDEKGEWVWGIDGLERGLHIARVLGFQGKLFKTYVDFIDSKLATAESTCNDAFALRLLTMLSEMRAGDSVRGSKVAETIADRLLASGNGFLARGYLDQAIRYYQLLQDSPNANRVGQKKGESLVKEAEACIANPSQGHLAASHHLAVGIECLRQSNADGSRIQKLHELLLRWQKNSLDEMHRITETIEISDMVEKVRQLLADKNLQAAILAMSFGHPLINPEKIRDRLVESMNEFPISHIFGGVILGRDGKVSAVKPSSLGSGGEIRKDALEIEMFQHAAAFTWRLRALAYIRVCQLEIWNTHRPSRKDLEFLVLHNQFVRPGHEQIFLKGIAAGFSGDFDIASHLLVPQIEESIRHLLQRAGHVTSKLDSKLIQEERLLRTLLSMPETTEMFGHEIIFELRGLLCEKAGCDLRNRLAHGFISHSECWGADVLNIWWLVIRLLCVPIIHMSSTPEVAEQVSSRGNP